MRRPSTEHLVPGQQEPDAVLSDYTLLPCLIEAHAHLFLQGAPTNAVERSAYLKLPADVLLSKAHTRLPALLQFGVGTVRDAGDNDGVGLALAADAKRNFGAVTTAPWIDSPGSALHHRGRYGAVYG